VGYEDVAIADLRAQVAPVDLKKWISSGPVRATDVLDYLVECGELERRRATFFEPGPTHSYRAPRGQYGDVVTALCAEELTTSQATLVRLLSFFYSYDWYDDVVGCGPWTPYVECARDAIFLTGGGLARAIPSGG
jgi:hypothetical protein